MLLVHMFSKGICYLTLKVVARLAPFTDTLFQYFQGFLKKRSGVWLWFLGILCIFVTHLVYIL